MQNEWNEMKRDAKTKCQLQIILLHGWKLDRECEWELTKIKTGEHKIRKNVLHVNFVFATSKQK